jgi:adenylosuccinate synthase
VIGNGVVIDLVSLAGELDTLRKQRVKVAPRQLLISDCAHLTLPYHRLLDRAREAAKDAQGGSKIGTTGRGIGPTYADKIGRTGIRLAEVRNLKRFAELVAARVEENNALLSACGLEPLDPAAVAAEYVAAARKVAPYVENTVLFLHEQLRNKVPMLFEGAQGTYLDIDHGTYPFVTSSNTTAGGACTGSGVPPHRIDSVMGVLKAYTTRVGGGPLPTEDQKLSDYLHGLGREFGATTGRARRCGWFDAVSTRYAAIINGIDELAVTNVDGLDETAEIRVCVGYSIGRKTLTHPPARIEELAACKPIYETLPGWQQDTTGVRAWRDLPAACRTYLETIAKLTEARLSLVSVGPDREQTIVVPKNRRRG